MHVRHLLVVAGIAGLLTLPATATAEPGLVASASGGIHWTVPPGPPSPFAVEVANHPLSFNAKKYTDGSVAGQFEYHQRALGESFNFHVEVTCMNVYDGNRAKIGGVITVSNDPTLPPGVFAWFQVFDNGEGANAPPDQSGLVGFGNEAANEAFCNSPNLPRFGPWDVEGNVQVRS
jgi:hypothetical protein